MIELKEIEGKNIYSFRPKGPIDTKDIYEFHELLLKKSNKDQSLKLLGILDEFPGYNIDTFIQLFKLKIEELKNIRKYAVLSNIEWIKTVMPIGNFVTLGIPLKHFSLGQMADAIDWLESEDPQ